MLTSEIELNESSAYDLLSFILEQMSGKYNVIVDMDDAAYTQVR